MSRGEVRYVVLDTFDGGADVVGVEDSFDAAEAGAVAYLEANGAWLDDPKWMRVEFDFGPVRHVGSTIDKYGYTGRVYIEEWRTTR